MFRDIYSNLKADLCFAPAVVTDNTAQAGAWIDRQGYGALAFAIAMGTLSDSDTTLAFTLTHGDEADASDEAACVAADYHGDMTATFADDGECRMINYDGIKRYVRLTATPTGNTGNIPISAVALLGAPQVAPVTQES